MTRTGVHVNAYLGDVSGDGTIRRGGRESDVRYRHRLKHGIRSLLAPGPRRGRRHRRGRRGHGNSVAILKGYLLNHASRPKIPVPPGLTGIVSPNAADPTLNLLVRGEPTGPGERRRVSSPVMTVSVMLDDPHPAGSTGLTEAILALTYDPSNLSVSAADITLGSLPGLGQGWQLNAVVDQTTGQIGIEIYSMTPITATQAGSLVNITFHVLPGERRA